MGLYSGVRHEAEVDFKHVATQCLLLLCILQRLDETQPK